MFSEITFPIFIFGDGDCIVLLRREDVGRELEHYDVNDGVYIGYDYNGRPLEFSVDEDMVVGCMVADSSVRHDELLRLLHTRLSDLDYCSYDKSDDSITKAMAIGIYAETNFECQSFFGWLRSIFPRGKGKTQ
ncbi:hypothetical protein [Pseudodesulfovibrio portus]|uniref:Uncharacterized protein n=1 Tax=Pseudodesulfovibrio portus TaxID=231439 RepID=A0ABN6RXE2_9BACT|nr:hypothetical protein [Pseudodesulfovibrio portus]BDQ34071.1 hypothetical protein JCM14722_16130 [Pseudodesulfovibrio portus]